jgi:hypothetical protein
MYKIIHYLNLPLKSNVLHLVNGNFTLLPSAADLYMANTNSSALLPSSAVTYGSLSFFIASMMGFLISSYYIDSLLGHWENVVIKGISDNF